MITVLIGILLVGIGCVVAYAVALRRQRTQLISLGERMAVLLDPQHPMTHRLRADWQRASRHWDAE